MSNYKLSFFSLFIGILSFGTVAVAAGTVQHRFNDVEALMDKIEEYPNANVSVSGEVEEVDSNSFILEGGGLFNDEVVVLFGKNLNANEKQLIREDANVMVQGQVKKGRVTDAAKEFGYQVESEVARKLRRANNYIVADRITRQAD